LAHVISRRARGVDYVEMVGRISCGTVAWKFRPASMHTPIAKPPKIATTVAIP
jgi:hypothetical protein